MIYRTLCRVFGHKIAGHSSLGAYCLRCHIQMTIPPGVDLTFNRSREDTWP